ncbi:MAG TPA: TrmH family RNA methyltransferase [Gammaproteobacteria bacterium]|nr:TrmH family RNA methyltransferase [Gammaproteobacteria bacterium]
MKTIHLSKETNEIQRIIALRNSRNKRYRTQEFIIEGTTAIEQAFKHNWPVKALFFNREIKLSDWAKHYIYNKYVEQVYAIPQELMVKISDRATCPEIIVVGQTNLLSFDSYTPRKPAIVLVLDEPKSAGNVGTIIRSSVAFQVDAIVISGHGADEYDPKCIRSSVGCFFSIPIYRADGFAKFLKKVDSLKTTLTVEIIATSDKGSVCIDDLKCNSDILFLILGNETKGISEGYKNIANQVSRIPLLSEFTSLNIGVAASIFLYEIDKKRRFK